MLKIKINNNIKEIKGIYFKEGINLKRLTLKLKINSLIKDLIKYIQQNILTYTFTESMSQSQSNKFTLNNLLSVDSLTVNTGNATYTVNGDDVMVTVNGGAPSRSIYNSNKYSKSASDSRTTQGSDTTPSSISYSSAGYSGTLYKVSTTSQTIQTGGSYTPADSKTISQTGGTITLSLYKKWNGSYWVDAGSSVTGYTGSTLAYNDGSYSGTLTKVGGATYTSGPYDYSPPSSPTVNQTYTSHYEAGYYTYSGTVTRPASDTRTYRTDYTAYYSGTIYTGGYDDYYSYTVNLKYTINI